MGAVGCSTGTPSQDEECARAGAEAVVRAWEEGRGEGGEGEVVILGHEWTVQRFIPIYLMESGIRRICVLGMSTRTGIARYADGRETERGIWLAHEFVSYTKFSSFVLIWYLSGTL